MTCGAPCTQSSAALLHREGVADFSNYPALYQKTAAFDEDLREILEADKRSVSFSYSSRRSVLRPSPKAVVRSFCWAKPRSLHKAGVELPSLLGGPASWCFWGGGGGGEAFATSLPSCRIRPADYARVPKRGGR